MYLTVFNSHMYIVYVVLLSYLETVLAPMITGSYEKSYQVGNSAWKAKVSVSSVSGFQLTHE